MKKKTPAQGQGGKNKSKVEVDNSTPRPTKWKRIMFVLCSRSLNRFEAASEYSDTCLNSTVPKIESRGVRVDRKMETVSGYSGIPIRCRRYWIAPDQHDAAKALLTSKAKSKAA